MTWAGAPGGGPHQHVSETREHAANARLDSLVEACGKSGDHLWIAAVGYRVVPPLGPNTLLDIDNMVVPPQIGCYRCEQEYTPWRLTQPCTGDPS
jgi:hypothetical protein